LRISHLRHFGDDQKRDPGDDGTIDNANDCFSKRFDIATMLHSNKWSWLKAWAMQIARAPRDEEGDRGPGTPVGCDHAPHMG
jgi:hypothetical protein